MTPKMQYGEDSYVNPPSRSAPSDVVYAVRLGNSGLKVSRLILGCMSYGNPQWQGWVLPEEEAVEHIKFACVYAHLPDSGY